MATPGINTKIKLDGEAEYRAALGSLNQATLMGDEEDEGGLL